MCGSKWSYRIHMNRQPSGWRERLAQRLRAWACILDGRISPALEIHTQPELPQSTINAVIRRSVDHMGRDLGIEARCAAEEQLVRRYHPDLFEDA